MMTAVINLMRIRQYVKNLFIFFPLFFALQITNVELFTNALIAFISFSLGASAVYVLNDYLDIKSDRMHPTKRNRPLASGQISKSKAKVLIVIFISLSLLIMQMVNQFSFFVLLFYIALNTLYSIKLKHIAILDVSIIAVGFVLRLFVGAYATNIELSVWIVMITFLLALFLALAKRRDDVLIFEKTGKKMRKVVDGYNIQLVDSAMTMMSAVVIVSYILYTISDSVISRVGSDNLYLTVFFVIIGILRYMQITFVEETSGNPTSIVT